MTAKKKAFAGVKTHVPKSEYKIGTRVYVTGLPGNPMGRITHMVYEGKGYGWHYKVRLYEGKSTPKHWTIKNLRKVRSDCKKRGKK